jgi:SAM-dependent methyltransferase
MAKFTDQAYLENEQYRDSSNLDTRASLHDRFSTNPQGWFAWMFDTLETLPAEGKLLDLGCGAGGLWRSHPERIPAGWSITLGDLSEGMLLSTWRRLVVTKRAYKYEKMDAQQIPYPDGSFDIVIANHMLYHVPDIPKALREIRRVLKPGGKLVASTVGKNHMQEIESWIKQIGLGPSYTPFQAAFSLENGQVELEKYFQDVKLLRYEDSLRITEIEPLIAYIRSRSGAAEVLPEQFETLQTFLEAEMSAKQALLVHKDSGLFLATC